MPVKTPSYLLLRNGIFYFQIRVAKESEFRPHGDLFRRSTGTGNRIEALKIARRWAVEIMGKDDSNKLADIDADADNKNREYASGRTIHDRLNQIDPNDGLKLNATIEKR